MLAELFAQLETNSALICMLEVAIICCVVFRSIMPLTYMCQDIQERQSKREETFEAIQNSLREIQLHQQVLLDAKFLAQGESAEEKMERLVIQSETANNQLLAASFSTPEMWSHPLYETLGFTGWTYTWNVFKLGGDESPSKRRYALQMQPPAYCFVYLDQGYETLTFFQSVRNRWTYYCLYGDTVIGYYKISGKKKKRSPRRFLREVCMNDNAWLISCRALRLYSLEEYSIEKFEERVKTASANHQQPLHLYSEANVEAERKLLASGRHHPEMMYMSFINLMFRYFIYQSLARKVEYLYGHQCEYYYIQSLFDSDSVTEKGVLNETLPFGNLPNFEREVQEVSEELKSLDYSFTYSSNF